FPFVEESFHLSRWRKGNQQPSRRAAGKRPGMRNLTRPQHAVSRLEVNTLGPDFHNVFAIQRVEEFIDIMVQMARRSSLFPIRLFQNEQASASVLCKNFVRGRTH